MTTDPHDRPPVVAASLPSRTQRLAELRQELHRGRPARRLYARDTLLALLWIEAEPNRHTILSALCNHPPEPDISASAPLIARLVSRLPRAASGEDLPPPPSGPELCAWAGQAAAAVLMESLDRMKAASRVPEAAPALSSQEAAVCLEALGLARLLGAEAAAEGCVRLLRLVSSAPSRAALLPVRQIGDLRDAACGVLAELSPDALFPLWSGLGGPDAAARQDLLPALDYLQDARAVPYLLRLLERRVQWTDGEIVGWFVVRAFERLSDRRALPALRKIAARTHPLRSLLPALSSMERAEAGNSPELAREARRVIQAIEQGKDKKERSSLLRPALRPAKELLRPAPETPSSEQERDREILLRSDPLSEEP